MFCSDAAHVTNPIIHGHRCEFTPITLLILALQRPTDTLEQTKALYVMIEPVEQISELE